MQSYADKWSIIELKSTDKDWKQSIENDSARREN